MLHMTFNTHDRETVNEARNAYKTALSALETAYRETVDGTPKQTIKTAVSALSAARCIREDAAAEMVFAVLASLVCGCSWDGRISARSAKWAANVPGCCDEQTAGIFGIYSNIHRAHLNQLAEAASSYAPIG